jgi:hypothetical protein
MFGVKTRVFARFAPIAEKTTWRTVPDGLPVTRATREFRPGELDAFVDELQERCGILIDSKKIKGVGDILGLIQVEKDPA